MLYEIERKLRERNQTPIARPNFPILLASYPKSGNTWLKFLVANYFNEVHCWYDEIDFHNIHFIVPEIARNRKLRDVVVDEKSPLFLKTHFPYTKYFNDYNSVLLVRDPADTLRSYYLYLTQEKSMNFINGIDGFLSHWRYGISAWVKFHEHWKGNSDYTISYEDLLSNTHQIVKNILMFYQIEVIDELLVIAIEKSTIQNMKKVLHKKGDPMAKNKQFEFVGKGKTGQSNVFFTEDQHVRIQNETAKMYNNFKL